MIPKPSFNKVITYSEMNLGKCPLSKLVLELFWQTQTEPQDSKTIRPNQINKITEHTTMLFDPKQRVNSGKIPDHCDWPKMKESFDYVQTQWA